jgi:hypothetical protein
MLQEFTDACGHLDLAPYPDGGAPPGEPPATLAATAGCGARGAASIAAMVRIGEIPLRTPGKMDKPFQSSGIGAGGSKKARSVVALSRVPR